MLGYDAVIRMFVSAVQTGLLVIYCSLSGSTRNITFAGFI